MKTKVAKDYMMSRQYHFKISRYCPEEEIFDGMMTFTEARKFMDEHATNERHVSYMVYDEYIGKWVDLYQTYMGDRMVIEEKGDIWILDADYRNMWPLHTLKTT